MDSIDPCNSTHLSNFLKNYTEQQVQQLLNIHKQLLQAIQNKHIEYSIDDVASCIDPIREYN